MAGMLTSAVASKGGAQSGKYHLGAEWERHAGCVMALCDANQTYGARTVKRMQLEQAKMATAIASFEPVTMLINPRQRKRAAAILPANIDLLEMSHHDVWTRDTLPTITKTPDGKKTAIDWNFNTWGNKYPEYGRDRTLAKRFAGAIDLPVQNAPIVCEGGAIELNGNGTLVTTETCLLNRNRNPGKSRHDVEQALRDMTGAANIVWLWGSEVDQITDGHIDGFMRFIRPGVVVAEVTDDPTDPEYTEMQENLARLLKARDSNGQHFEVHLILRPRWDVMPNRGNDFAASYVNSYFPNGGIVMPSFDDPERDKAAKNLFQALEPNRRIIQIDVSEICEGGGGIHCNTMQIPV